MVDQGPAPWVDLCYVHVKEGPAMVLAKGW